jgi:nitroimidazol reductase NimA-like FMN-containing flavoprotein (pyridoxamine 5'-phosphate oxidase superfamily)
VKLSDMNEPATHEDASGDVVWMSELELDTCWRLVEQQPVGRVAFIRGGRPMILPVNHVTDHHTIVFRTERNSPLGDLAAREPVAFEVDVASADRQTGWSVLVRGEAERIDAPAKRRIDAPGPQPWAPGDRDEWIRIVPSTITGRAISRRRRQSDGTFLPYMPAD